MDRRRVDNILATMLRPPEKRSCQARFRSTVDDRWPVRARRRKANRGGRIRFGGRRTVMRSQEGPATVSRARLNSTGWLRVAPAAVGLALALAGCGDGQIAQTSGMEPAV